MRSRELVRISVLTVNINLKEAQTALPVIPLARPARHPPQPARIVTRAPISQDRLVLNHVRPGNIPTLKENAKLAVMVALNAAATTLAPLAALASSSTTVFARAATPTALNVPVQT